MAHEAAFLTSSPVILMFDGQTLRTMLQRVKYSSGEPVRPVVPNFFGTRDWFRGKKKKRQFSQGLGCRVWGGSNTLHLLCTLSLLFLHQLHLRSSSGISPWNLGTPVVRRCSNMTLKGHMVLLLPFFPVQMIFLNTESNQTLFCVVLCL